MRLSISGKIFFLTNRANNLKNYCSYFYIIIYYLFKNTNSTFRGMKMKDLVYFITKRCGYILPVNCDH